MTSSSHNLRTANISGMNHHPIRILNMNILYFSCRTDFLSQIYQIRWRWPMTIWYCGWIFAPDFNFL